MQFLQARDGRSSVNATVSGLYFHTLLSVFICQHGTAAYPSEDDRTGLFKPVQAELYYVGWYEMKRGRCMNNGYKYRTKSEETYPRNITHALWTSELHI